MQNQHIDVTEFGGPETLKLVTDDQLPEPATGELRIRVLVTSAAFTDTMIRKGMYPDVKEKPPFTLGYDLVGIVDKLGPGAGQFALGDCVADLTTIGAYSQYICLPEHRLTKVPDKVSPVDALGMVLSAVTSYQMLHRVAKVQAGQRILVHGAGGAVGTMMLQLAKLAGLTAFGTDRAPKHELIQSLGGTPIDSDAAELETLMRDATGDGVDVVFDPLGGASLSRSLHILRPGGMLVAYGFQEAVMGHGGNIPLDFVKLKLWDWMPNGHATAFYSIGAMRRQHPEWFKEDLAVLFDLLAKGEIKPVVAQAMPFTEARKAHEMIERGEAKGKIVLLVGE